MWTKHSAEEFHGNWYELTPRRKIMWSVHPDNDFWSYDPDGQILRIRHINMRDEVFVVRVLSPTWIHLLDPIDHSGTFLRR